MVTTATMVPHLYIGCRPASGDTGPWRPLLPDPFRFPEAGPPGKLVQPWFPEGMAIAKQAREVSPQK
jgi:hypothetical protein